MSTENENDFIDKVVDKPKKVESEIEVVKVAKLTPKPKQTKRAKKSAITASKLDVTEVIVPVVKSTQFKKTAIKIMPGSYRSGMKEEKAADKSKKNNKITESKKGFDFS